MANKSQTGVGLVDASVTLTGSSQQLMAQNNTRGALLIQNIGNANIGLAFAPLSAYSTVDGTLLTTPSVTASIGAAGTLTIVPGGSYEPDGGFIPMNAIFVIGTASQIVTAYQSS